MSTAKKLDENVASSSGSVGSTAVSGGVAKSDRFPEGIPFIVGNEGAERFSFYGMKAILKIYLIALTLRFVSEKDAGPAAVAAATSHSTEIVHLFVAGVYAFPLLGAIIADRWLGKYRVIMGLSLVYCLGHAVLAVAGRMGELQRFGAAEWGMYIGLGLIAFGSGGIKPCVSANVGDQFTSANGHLVTKVFQTFYFMINFGSFFSTLLIPYTYDNFGPEIAFGIPGVLMFIATIVFWMGRKKFVKVEPKPGGALGALDAGILLLLLFVPLTVVCFFGPLPLTADFVFAADPTSPEVRAAFAGGAETEAFKKFLTGSEPVNDLIKAGTPLSAGAYFSVLASHYWLHGIITVLSLVVGAVLFMVRQRKVADNSFLPVLLYSITHQKLRKPGQSFFDPAREKYGQEAGDGPPAVLRIMVVFSMISVFWALFDQHASTWIDQAKMMGLGLTFPAATGYWAVGSTLALSGLGLAWILLWVSNKKIPRNAVYAVLGLIVLVGVAAAINDVAGIVPLGDNDGVWKSITMNPAQLSALNPLMVMMIIPFLNVAVYAPIKKYLNYEVKPLQKMTAGMFLAALAFGAAAIMQQVIESRAAAIAGGATDVQQVHSLWQAVQYLIMTTSEVLVSITGLEFAYTQAPRAMKSTIMSFWLLCVTFGNLLVAFLSPLQSSLALSSFFWVFAGLMAAASVIFVILALTYRGKTYLQDAPAAH